ncbi:Hypothetical_protein [Hexamita inflata]|uniref:Hypothetical_protein n=1 Tax=Hexamita inflata TaxID=28002 RepID=A0AA86U5S1_9EUKA|nr:Hypothetical protein HINF_LOCUS29669 [Hexamita inflata]
MSIVYHKIIQGIAGLLQLEYSPDFEHQIIAQVLSLPNQLFIRLLVQLSFALNVEYNALLNYFNMQIAPKYTQKSTYKFKFTQARTQPENLIHFKRIFSQALKTVLQTILNQSVSFESDAHMCQYVNEHFKVNGQVDFWVKMNGIISEKSKRQLREYYQKSFQRCMYLECISEPDKELLCSLIDQMQDQKPSAVVGRFLSIIGTEKYFKRNVVMYVINRRSK